jgi:O-acetyl-ADP-ribose deacetylase (regulator of RNase III)
MKYIDGDLIILAKEGKFDVIGHGCNCFHSFGAGFAKAVKEEWPAAHLADKCSRYGDRNKLGSFTSFKAFVPNELIILNLYTQFKYTSTEVDVEYGALRRCMKEVKKMYSGKRIGLPMIGCGLAKGNWDIVSQIIEDELGDEDITIIKFNKL